MIEDPNNITRIQVLASLLLSWLNPQAGSPHGSLPEAASTHMLTQRGPGEKSEFVSQHSRLIFPGFSLNGSIEAMCLSLNQSLARVMKSTG